MSRVVQHDPAGRGHAYRPSLTQRLPIHPVEGQPVSLGAVSAPDLGELTVELAVDGVTHTIAAQPRPLVDDDAAGSSDGGHLAAAATAGERLGEARPWQIDLGSFPAGTHLRYRFVAGEQVTADFECTVAGWQPRGGTLSLHAPGGGIGDRLVAGSVEWLVADRGPIRVRFELGLEDDEHLIGLGERFHALDQRGWSIDTKVFEQYKAQHTRTYLPVPFALVTGGTEPWGVHVAMTRRCWFDVGATRHSRLIIEVACDPDVPEPVVPVHLFVGDTPAEVLSAFWDVAGRPRTTPSWVFRPWMSANEWNSQARVEHEVGRTLDLQIPAGVLVIEAWSDEATFTCFRDSQYEPHPDGAPHQLDDFVFPAHGAWPDPAGMVRWLHDHDIKVLLWQIPLLPDGPDDVQLAYDRHTLIDHDLAVKEADGTPYRNRGWWFPGSVLPDFTNPDAIDWWTAKRRYLVDEVGIDGFKTDGGEHAWGDQLRYADGTRGDVSNDRFPNVYAGAYHQLFADSGVEGVTFSRAGSTGAGTVPCHWAGDEDSTWDAYRAAIVAGLTAGISGIVYWGWDHGGFSGNIPDAELYLRTAAQASLCPIMQYHAEHNDHRVPSNDRTPWNIAERTGDPRVLPTYRRLAVLRDRLVDELDQQTRRGIDRGLPLMRALCLEWPHDPEVWNHPTQYLLGDDLLVAPVTEPGATRWPIYVPGDRWADPWTGEIVDGRATVEVEAPLDRPPVLIRFSAAGRLQPLFDDLPG